MGNLWGTHVMSDRIFALTPQGEMRIILDDDRPEPSKRLYEAFARDEATPELMLACGGEIAPWFASVTFGGPDLRNVYIGSLRGTRIPWFRATGGRPSHGALAEGGVRRMGTQVTGRRLPRRPMTIAASRPLPER